MPAWKENPGCLYEDVRDLFEGAEEFGFAGARRHYAATLNEGRGRPERRERWVISGLDCLECLSNGREWPSLRLVAGAAGRRETGSGVTVQPGCYISSLEAPATRLLEEVRNHWSIGKSPRWSLDVAFGEDQCRVRKDNGPENMAALRQISHSLLKRETSLKAGIQSKRLQAGWRENCLLKVFRS